ncbi:MAG TPA: hypothetical protein VGM19_12390 [Armatimonadota bacterium]
MKVALLRLVCLVAVVLAFGSAAGAQAPAAGAKPSVLWVPLSSRGWEQTDFPSFQRFARDGIQMDYLDSYPLTLEKMKKYNVVAFMDLTIYNSTGLDEQLLKNLDLIDQYLAAGGSVWLLPNLDWWGDSVPMMQAMQKYLFPRYGIRYLFGQWITDTGTLDAGIWPRNKYAYTTNFASHPITQGLRGIWYPIDSSGRMVPSTTPLLGDENWQVILSGSPTASSALSEAQQTAASNNGYPLDLLAAKGYDSAPPILEVRDLKQGRMAFMAMNGTFHLMGGSSRGLDGVTMEGKGINNIPNDLPKLFENTFRWLAEPSLKSGSVGGYVQDGNRLVEFKPQSFRISADSLQFPAEKTGQAPNMAELATRARAEGTTVDELLGRMRGEVPSFRGLIGARSNLSTGSDSPADLIAAAKAAGLDYVVFLEDFTALTPDKLKALQAACAAGNTDKFRAIPGFQIDDNRDHSQFFFGEHVVWPDKIYLTADGKQFDVAARPDSSGLPQIGFMISFAQGANALGYFNFKPHRSSAPMWDLRLYNSVGLTYYQDGQAREGLTDNFRDYLEIVDQGLNPMPYSVDIVTSAAQLAASVKTGHFLTCARAPKLEKVMESLWYSYLAPPMAYVSQGPVIRDWDCTNRDYTGVGENFITLNYRWRVRCHLTSEVGLRELVIWDGPQVFRRLLLNGEKDYTNVFELSHNQQKNLVLEVTDLQGRKAISAEQFDRNQLNYHFWCSDRENGNLYHGPYAFAPPPENGPVYPGKGIDTNGNLGVPFYYQPYLSSDQGIEGQERLNNRNYQYFVSEDTRIFKEETTKKYPPTEKVWMTWGTYGPLVDTELMDFRQSFVAYRTGYQYWPLPETPDQPDKAWVAPLLFQGQITFKRDMTLKDLVLMSCWTPWDMYKVPGQQVIQAVSHTKEGVAVAAEFQGGFVLDNETRLAGPYTIEKDGFMAVFGLRPVGSGVIYNLGDPIVFRHDPDQTRLLADLAGHAVKKGQVYNYAFLTLSGRTADANSVQRYEEIRRFLGMGVDRPGYALTLKQGKLIAAHGLLDLQAERGAVDLTIPSPEKKLHVILGLRVYGLNSRWSAGLFDRATGKYRPLGVMDDIAYVRLNPETGESRDVVLGHPVIADRPEVFITFTKLTDQPGSYYCAVNNPTDQPLTVKITPAMPLPGLTLAPQTVRIPAGGEVVLLK